MENDEAVVAYYALERHLLVEAKLSFYALHFTVFGASR